MGVLHNPIAPLTADEWTTVEQLCKILQPFEQVSVELSAEENVTISKVILLAHNLQAACIRMQTMYTSEVAQELLKTLISNVDRRFKDAFDSMVATVQPNPASTAIIEPVSYTHLTLPTKRIV